MDFATLTSETETQRRVEESGIKIGDKVMLPVMNKSWFPAVFDDFFNSDWMPRMNATAPAVNVKEDSQAYTMEIAAPGIKKEFCRVNINNEGNLEIAIENKVEHKDENKNERYLRREFSYTNYQQVYQLPANVDKDHISAKVEQGILVVTLPKITAKEESQSGRVIEVS